ncbi:MAG: endolytic transglycosylase MltG [Saprospiraceae bacterium]|nr:endolytic transglycosylase MltG [Saprospiraceae bacterium]
MNEGLPPGPVCMPTLASIEAVLKPETHNFHLFLCTPRFDRLS